MNSGPCVNATTSIPAHFPVVHFPYLVQEVLLVQEQLELVDLNNHLHWYIHYCHSSVEDYGADR